MYQNGRNIYKKEIIDFTIMKHLIFCVIDNILPIGLIISILYGFFADKIFWTDKERKENFEGEYGGAKRIHQFWLNFVGSFVGWFCVYLFLNILLNIRFSELSVAHVLLFGFGVIGIVGWLPVTLHSVVISLGEILKKFIDFGKPKE